MRRRSRRDPSAAAPSPFPPIAEYAFLSNCHTGALVAPDGAVDWLCVPRFDSPSVFGTLLDRQAGSFRFAPYGINVPTTRIYEPGTNILATTWHTPTGWLIVRDALTMGPTRGDDRVTPHTRPPADEDAEHLLVRVALCLEGEVELELVCEPDFDYGRAPGEWTMVGDDRHAADAAGAGVTVRLSSDLALGVEADRVRARHVLTQGEQAFCSLSWEDGLASSTSSRRPASTPARVRRSSAPCRSAGQNDSTNAAGMFPAEAVARYWSVTMAGSATNQERVGEFDWVVTMFHRFVPMPPVMFQ